MLDSSKKTINFDYLKSFLNLKNQERFEAYIEIIFPDLCTYKNNQCLGISRTKFYNLFNLPIFICEKLFSSFDLNTSGFLSIEELIKPLSLLYFGSFEETALVIFNIYDFSKNGEATANNIKTTLSFLPLKPDKTKPVYKSQLESLKELDELLKITFSGKESLSFKDFFVVLQTNSDIYIQMLCLLYKTCPFEEKSVKKTVKIHSKMKISSNKYLSPPHQTQKKFDDIYLLTRPLESSHFSPVDDFINNFLFTNNSCRGSSNIHQMSSLNLESIENFTESSNKEKNHLIGEEKSIRQEYDNINSFSDEYLGLKGGFKAKQVDEEMKSLHKQDSFDGIIDKQLVYPLIGFNINLDNSNNSYDSNSFTNKDLQNNQEPQDINENNHLKNINLDDFSKPRKSKSILLPLIDNERDILYQGELTRYTKEKDKLYTIWLVLIDQNIYYFTDKTKLFCKRIHHIYGCFINENGSETIQQETYSSFSIEFLNNTRTYYSKEFYSVIQWIKQLRKSLNYKNFFVFYQLIDDISKDNFGEIKLGINYLTKDKVEVKIIDKTLFNEEEFEQIRRGISVMKTLNHPNITKLIDVFENSKYVFVIMEYTKFGSLDKLIKPSIGLSEEISAKIVYQIVNGLKYLSEYGVVHRDIKPENINVVKTTDFLIKISGFELSTILSPQETTTEGFRSMVFVAPEVLLNIPYRDSVDIWSLGVVTYYIVTGTYPIYDLKLYDKDDKNTSINVKVDHLEFLFKKDNLISNEVKDLISLCLIKDKDKRIEINQVLNHKWLVRSRPSINIIK